MRTGLRAVLGAALTLATVAAVPAPVSAGDPPRRVLIAGDSVGFSLFPALREAGAAHGVQVETAALFGCPVVDGAPVDDNGRPFPTVPVCPVDRPAHYRTAVARFRPDVVVWISGWETSARIVDGQVFRFGTITGNRDLLHRVDDAVHWLTADGARVVFVPLAPSAQPSAHGVPSPTNDERMVGLANLLGTYAHRHPEAASVVDLPALICPDGPPCPAEVDGVVPRPSDGVHFAGTGAAWVAERVLRIALQIPEPRAQAAAQTNAGLTAHASRG